MLNCYKLTPMFDGNQPRMSITEPKKLNFYVSLYGSYLKMRLYNSICQTVIMAYQKYEPGQNLTPFKSKMGYVEQKNQFFRVFF